MPKINQEEYEILKELDEKWKWIARDDSYGGSLLCFEDKPCKNIKSGTWSPDATDYEYLERHDLKFQFIQWEDEEPYSIAELIREYEFGQILLSMAEDETAFEFTPESEEKEVKDREWLRKELVRREDNFVKLVENEQGIDYNSGKQVATRQAIKLIDQLDEPVGTFEQEAVEELIGKYSKDDMSTYCVKVERDKFVKDLQNLLVPKQETIDVQIEEGKVKLIVGFDGGTEIINAQNIEEALDILTDYDASFTITKVPVIPQFVADWIDDCKDKLLNLTHCITPTKYPSSVSLYIDEIGWKEWEKLVARAWLDGYEIEQEPKYYICLPNISGEKEVYVWYQGKTSKYYTTNNKTIKEVAGNKIKFTEQEIKDYDERYWAFAEPVEGCMNEI